ncbi:AAA family ATPase [Asanoa sp. NPDC050611]|uniref:AAA family ATPase n=1 Tax=Asanoa sp. NPDC050611 TaxID=3157098 RepID=UPI00340EC121
MGRVPVLWLYGPPGVGKTSVAWELFSRLGVPAALVDIDQLGICYGPAGRPPEPASDPGRHRMKARNLDAVVANFGAAGASCVVVPGVVDSARGVDVGLLPRAAVTAVRLRASPGALRERLARRGRPTDQAVAALREAEALDRLPGECVDTTGLGVAEVARLVKPFMPAAGGGGVLTGPVPAPGEVLLLCGPLAVGKSTVGWEVYQRSSLAGVHTAFVDLEQIGFCRPAPADHRLRSANLAALWRTYHARGARRLVVVGHIDGPADVAAYTAALPAATVTVCRLHASAGQLAERIALRTRGIGATWGLAGDELTGRPAPAGIHARAAAQAAALERAGIGDQRLDTDGRTVAEVVAAVRWPGPVAAPRWSRATWR